MPASVSGEILSSLRPNQNRASHITVLRNAGFSPDIDGLRARVDALCVKRPLYPGFRGYTTYVA